MPLHQESLKFTMKFTIIYDSFLKWHFSQPSSISRWDFPWNQAAIKGYCLWIEPGTPMTQPALQHRWGRGSCKRVPFLGSPRCWRWEMVIEIPRIVRRVPDRDGIIGFEDAFPKYLDGFWDLNSTYPSDGTSIHWKRLGLQGVGLGSRQISAMDVGKPSWEHSFSTIFSPVEHVVVSSSSWGYPRMDDLQWTIPSRNGWELGVPLWLWKPPSR